MRIRIIHSAYLYTVLTMVVSGIQNITNIEIWKYYVLMIDKV